jgi:hypothetical protein
MPDIPFPPRPSSKIRKRVYGVSLFNTNWRELRATLMAGIHSLRVLSRRYQLLFLAA